MTNLNRLTLGVMTAALVIACDPYPKNNTSAPQIVTLLSTDFSTAVEGTQTGGAWTVDLRSSCAAGVQSLDQYVFFVTFNKLMDGASIETATVNPTTGAVSYDCRPAGSWLTVAGITIDAANAWYTCYAPSAAIPGEGGSVVIFQQVTTADNTGWTNAETLPNVAGTPAYTFSGPVMDQQGRTFTIDFTAQVLSPAISDLAEGTVTTTTIELTWSAPGCGAVTTSYEVARSVRGGPFEVIAASVAAGPYTDAGPLTPSTTYSYRVTPYNGTTAGSPAFVDVKTLTPPPPP